MAQAVAHDFQKKTRTDDVRISENVDFAGLLLSPDLLSGLADSGFKRPSPIQLKAIPLGRCGLDLIVQAKSGTGKTVVFTVIALESLKLDSLCTQVLVLAPTREIAVQIWEVTRSISSKMGMAQCQMFIGGTPLHQDRQKLKACHIAIGTPGRIKQLIELEILKTESVRLFVLDEADKLLEDSFQEPINWIYSSLPDNKQMLALSATYPEYMAQQLTLYMRNPTFVRLNSQDPALLGIKQYYEMAPFHPFSHKVYENKTKVLIKLLSSVSFQQCLIFSNLQTRAQSLCDTLNSKGWPCVCIAGCLEQQQRQEAMQKLKSFQCRVLISTDLTSRGIDAENVNLVVNLDLPHDHETYLHRIGRAGRFGSFGAGVTLVSGEEERGRLRALEEKCSTLIHPLPDPAPSDLVDRDLPVSLSELVTTETIVTRNSDAIPQHSETGTSHPPTLEKEHKKFESEKPRDTAATQQKKGIIQEGKTVSESFCVKPLESICNEIIQNRSEQQPKCDSIKLTEQLNSQLLLEGTKSSISAKNLDTETVTSHIVSNGKTLAGDSEGNNFDCVETKTTEGSPKDVRSHDRYENGLDSGTTNKSDDEESMQFLKTSVDSLTVHYSNKNIASSDTNCNGGNGERVGKVESSNLPKTKQLFDSGKIVAENSDVYSLKLKIQDIVGGDFDQYKDVIETEELNINENFNSSSAGEKPQSRLKKNRPRKPKKKNDPVLMEEFGSGASFEVCNTDMVILERPTSASQNKPRVDMKTVESVSVKIENKIPPSKPIDFQTWLDTNKNAYKDTVKPETKKPREITHKQTKLPLKTFETTKRHNGSSQNNKVMQVSKISSNIELIKPAQTESRSTESKPICPSNSEVDLQDRKIVRARRRKIGSINPPSNMNNSAIECGSSSQGKSLSMSELPKAAKTWSYASAREDYEQFRKSFGGTLRTVTKEDWMSILVSKCKNSSRMENHYNITLDMLQNVLKDLDQRFSLHCRQKDKKDVDLGRDFTENFNKMKIEEKGFTPDSIPNVGQVLNRSSEREGTVASGTNQYIRIEKCLDKSVSSGFVTHLDLTRSHPLTNDVTESSNLKSQPYSSTDCQDTLETSHAPAASIVSSNKTNIKKNQMQRKVESNRGTGTREGVMGQGKVDQKNDGQETLLKERANLLKSQKQNTDIKRIITRSDRRDLVGSDVRDKSTAPHSWSGGGIKPQTGRRVDVEESLSEADESSTDECDSASSSSESDSGDESGSEESCSSEKEKHNSVHKVPGFRSKTKLASAGLSRNRCTSDNVRGDWYDRNEPFLYPDHENGTNLTYDVKGGHDDWYTRTADQMERDLYSGNRYEYCYPGFNRSYGDFQRPVYSQESDYTPSYYQQYYPQHSRINPSHHPGYAACAPEYNVRNPDYCHRHPDKTMDNFLTGEFEDVEKVSHGVQHMKKLLKCQFDYLHYMKKS